MTRVRRLLIVFALVTASAVPASAGIAAPSSLAAASAGEAPTTTKIKHFVALMQENHSFDNYFGHYPGADGLPAGTCMPVHPRDPGGPCVRPFHIGHRPIVDLGHSVRVFDSEYDNGKMDGFISAFEGQPGSGHLAMGYYDGRDLPYYYNIADNYVLFDRMFTSAAGGSVWNHFYWVTGTPGNPANDSILPGGFDSVPTIFDRLQAAGISWKFYVQSYDPGVTFRHPGNGERASQIVWCPLLDYNRFLDNPALNSHIVPMQQYYTDLQQGTLPAVSFMVPAGTSEHPPGSIQAGMRFVRGLITALTESTAWDSSAFMWTYDDWGGWYDHVRPPKVDKWGYGMRAPALLVSPYARAGFVDHTQLDFTSELKFIEDNWGVKPLASRDRRANDITSAFDFTHGPRPPVLLSEQRHVKLAAPPRTAAVFAGYGGAGLVTLALLVAGVLPARRQRRERRGARP